MSTRKYCRGCEGLGKVFGATLDTYNKLQTCKMCYGAGTEAADMPSAPPRPPQPIGWLPPGMDTFVEECRAYKEAHGDHTEEQGTIGGRVKAGRDNE